MRARITAALVLIAAILVAGWPWSAGRLVFVKRGTHFTMLAVDHLHHALIGGADWKDAPMAWPLKYGITQLDWVGALAVLTLPISSLDPLYQHTFLVWTGLLLTGLACIEVARALLGPGPHTWIAGIIGALNPAVLSDAAYSNLLHHEAAVFGCLGIAVGLSRGKPLWAGLGALAVGAGGHFGIYVGVHGWAMGLVIAAIAGAYRLGDRRSWGVMVVGSTLALASLVPVLVAYDESQRLYQVGLAARDLELRSVPITSLLLPLRGVPLHEAVAGWMGARAQPYGFNPGWCAAILAAIGAWSLRGRWQWGWSSVLAVGLVAAGMALGPVIDTHWGPSGIPGPAALLANLPGGDALRSPFRWLPVVWMALGVFAAAGAQALGSRARWGAVLLGLGLFAEILVPDGMAPLASQDLHPIYREVAAIEAPGALLDINAGTGGDGTERIRAAFVHGRPRFGGTYARTSLTHQQLNDFALRWPAPEAVELLRVLGVLVVVDKGRGEAAGDCRSAEGHRICVLEPWAPLREVTPDGTGDVVALRFASPPGELTILCPGKAPWTTDPEMWRLVSDVRRGVGSESMDVFLPEPCDTGPDASVPGGVPMYAPGNPFRAAAPQPRAGHPEIGFRHPAP